MHTEAVKTRIFDVTPVAENSQLHKSVNHIAWILCGGEGSKVRRREEKGKKVKHRKQYEGVRKEKVNVKGRRATSAYACHTLYRSRSSQVISCVSVNIMSSEY